MKNDGSIPELDDYPGVIALPVEWGVQDAFGHVNNVIYFRWFESARIDYLNLLDIEGFAVERSESPVGPILASIKCDYKKQLKFPDTVHIGTTITRLGNSSIQIEHAVYSEAHKSIASTGESVVVVFDYPANKVVRIPGSLKRAICDFEGKEL